MRFIVLVSLVFFAAAAQAYVGPGAGLGVIGAILGTLMAIVMAIAGVIWYPVKRLLTRKSQAGAARDSGGESTRSK